MGTDDRSQPRGARAVAEARAAEARAAVPVAPPLPLAPPLLRVVRGEPTDEELAALVVVVAMRSGAAAPAPVARSLWRSRSRNIRPAVSPSPGAWRASGLPR